LRRVAIFNVSKHHRTHERSGRCALGAVQLKIHSAPVRGAPPRLRATPPPSLGPGVLLQFSTCVKANENAQWPSDRGAPGGFVSPLAGRTPPTHECVSTHIPLGPWILGHMPPARHVRARHTQDTARSPQHLYMPQTRSVCCPRQSFTM